MYILYVNLPIIHLSKNTRKCSIVKNTLHTLINLQTNQVCDLCFVSGLSDKPTLKCCRNVSRHWRYLADDLVLDQNAKKVLRNQVLIMQVWDFTVMNLYIHILVIYTSKTFGIGKIGTMQIKCHFIYLEKNHLK